MNILIKMSELHNLRPAKGSVKNRKRVGRGQGSGRGGTSTRGHKGAQSRSGYSRKRGFEGGQTPIQMRLPKRGFKNINRVEYIPINVDRLQAIAEKYNLTTINFEALRKIGMLQRNDKVKILGDGEITTALTVEIHACSASAKTAIEAAGGSVSIVGRKDDSENN